MLGYKYGILPLYTSPGIEIQGKASVAYATLSAPLADGLAIARSGSAKVWDASGAMVAAAADTPRFDHGVQTVTPNGLLLETSATNLLPHSVATASNWINDSSSPIDLSLNALGVFPGVQVPSSGIVWSRVKQGVNLANGVNYAITCYFRAGTSPNMRIAISGTGGETFVSGPIGSPSNTRQDLGVCSSIVETVLADGVTRQVKFVFTSKVSGAYQIGLGPQSSVSGKDIILLGFQVEEGVVHSSFIETGSAAAARAADVLTLTDLTGTYNLALSYSDRADVIISGANVTPGYVLPTNNAHLLSVTATPANNT